MRVLLTAFAVALCYATYAQTQHVSIGVVEQQPERARHLAAAVEAALRVASADTGEAPGGGATSDVDEAPPEDDDASSVHIAAVEPDEPLAVPAHVCEQASEARDAVVSGGGARAMRLAEAAAARAGLPLLLVDPAPTNSSWEALALYPHPDVLAQACAELCKEKGWRRAVLLHEGSAEGAALIAPDVDVLFLHARQLPPPHDHALLRNLLLVLKKLGATNFIVWCEAECAVRVLDAAQRVGLLAERHSYIVLSLELHTAPLAAYSHGGANVTGFRLFDTEAPETRAAMTAWRDSYTHIMHREPDRTEDDAVATAPPTAMLLAFQGAALAAEVLQRLQLPPAAPADCGRPAGAFHADTLLNYLRSEEWSGGAVAGVGGTWGTPSWETDGARRSVQLEVVELARGGRLERAGLWSPNGGFIWQRKGPKVVPLPDDSMKNKTFTVLIAMSEPYVMKQESALRLSGNDRYEGFCIELIDRLATQLGFNYTYVEQEDGVYGGHDATTGEWTGMIGRLMREDDVHFAITDLTITEERERAVDFTTPFMNLGISILFRKPETPEPQLFAFLLPFSNGVWVCLGFAYLGTSLILYVVGRLCHEEWQNPYPCIEDPPALENQFTLANALWFNLGAVLLQGSEIAPVAYGTRAVAGAWWLFALVITSSYTANLATLLATKSSTDLINNVQELANNDLGISYGAKDGGSTYTFFKNSKSELYQKMYNHMKEYESPRTNAMGIKKVETEMYAFLMESTTIEYIIERNCKVAKVGDLLDSKGYGIAMKKNSTYRQAMNLALLNLQEAGILREMKKSWWIEKHGGGACKDEDTYESEELKLSNFLGLFVVLGVGCALGVVISCCDLAWAAARRPAHPSRPPQPFAARFWEELRFVFRFEHSVKPLQGPLTGSSSRSGSTERVRESVSGGSGGKGAAEAEAGAGEEGTLRVRTGSGAGARRRSSMHAASVRLARHTSPAVAHH
ncbi:hypothetical protein K1T71_001020 [Dendrolimus kikuchii]|uniref:Uncharacterized protein n=1 Tax=Dendrolimus kikuchii TaxID=765133 RepID=A0ACC1DGF6_9NEOP|nr:hypothetical protein K1T71_001020 [Dendrolimus kikuchii]